MVQPTTTNGDINVVESYEDEVNNLGDQDTENVTSGYHYPSHAFEPTAQNVRRYPELFPTEVIESFDVVAEYEVTEADEAVLDETTVDASAEPSVEPPVDLGGTRNEGLTPPDDTKPPDDTNKVSF